MLCDNVLVKVIFLCQCHIKICINPDTLCVAVKLLPNAHCTSMASEWLSSVNSKSECGTNGNFLGLYGWRRQCLLFTLAILLTSVTVNLAMSLWMLKVVHFSKDGMGVMKIIPGGIQLRGEAMVLDKLIASKFGSRKGQPIKVESSKNISLMARNSDGRVNSKLFLGDDRLEIMANSLKISDSRGRMLFSADKRELLVGAEVVRISTEGGTVIHGSLEAPLVRPEAGQNLRLESPTRSLNVFALHGVNIESRAGDVNVNCLADFKVQSKTGSVRLDAPNIFIPKLATANTQKSTLSSSSSSSKSGAKSQVFQVCVCGKGRLFLAPPEGPCVADNDVCR